METTLVTMADILRDGRTRRTSPLPDVSGIRAHLLDGIYAVIGGRPVDQPVVVRASSFRQADTAAYTPYGRMRGALLTQTLRLFLVNFSSRDPFASAVAAWRASEGASELVDYFDAIDDDERARLATDVAAHSVTLTQRVGQLPATWRPRTAVRTRLRLGGVVELRDHVDLMVGSVTTGSGVAVVDLTTSPLDESLERALRYHALVESLRTSRPPTFVAALSTASGDMWRCEVDDELLLRGVADLIAVLSSREEQQ
ncbi:MAG: hypothetical protein KJS64_04655 [Acidobacteria bacterium]|nr:hypothetical protein [Acidobacteriota bacterium]